MNDWIHALPVGWMAVVVFGGTYLVTAAIYALVIALATGERARTFKGVSPGLLSPLGIIFGLLIAFLAAQVWSDVDRAHLAVNREASSLRGVVLLSRAFPGAPETHIRSLVAQHIRDARDVEWPAMAHQRATLTMVPAPLAEALQTALMLSANSPGQVTAQREIITSIENALDARRQRILASRASVDWVKWSAVMLQALCTLVVIALVHSDARGTAQLALGLFATAVAVCIVLLAAHDPPFGGPLGVQPTPLLNVQPDSTSVGPGT